MTSIFFSGAEEPAALRKLISLGVTDVMVSFVSILSRGSAKSIAETKKAYPNLRIYLEPGVHAYLKKYDYRPFEVPPPREFIRMYLEYAIDTKDVYDFVLEPDFDSLLAEWYDLAVNMAFLVNRGVNVMPVWHPWRGRTAWNIYCQNPHLKGLTIGKEAGEVGYQRMLIQDAHTAGKVVHGLGVTKINTDLRILPFDSVNSTSWLTGQKYGMLFVFQEGVFTILSPKNGRSERQKQFMKHFKKHGLNCAKLFANSQAETTKANIIAWRDLSARLQVMRKIQGVTDERGN